MKVFLGFSITSCSKLTLKLREIAVQADLLPPPCDAAHGTNEEVDETLDHPAGSEHAEI